MNSSDIGEVFLHISERILRREVSCYSSYYGIGILLQNCHCIIQINIVIHIDIAELALKAPELRLKPRDELLRVVKAAVLCHT